RADGIGLGLVFEQIVYQRDLAYMLEHRWLVPLRGYRVHTEADLRHLSGRGDFQPDALEEAIDIQQRNDLVARSIQELARDRRTLVFCVTVRHAKSLSKMLNSIGVPTGMVHGNMHADRRREELEIFRQGKLQALTNVGVLTEGFDDPEVSCIAMARPTRSEGLYMQCVGRGTRLYPDKKDCLVLDFVDLSDLSLVTLPSLFGLPKDLNLQGKSVTSALEVWHEIVDELPDFQVDPGAISLDEIRDRAASFDPLSRELEPAIRAISELAWNSLGPRGLSLHLLDRRGKLIEVLIVRDGGSRRPWVVAFNGEEQASFSRLDEAVSATEYELAQRDESLHLSGRPDAIWREQPVEGPLASIATQANRGRPVQGIGKALAAITYMEQMRARAKLKKTNSIDI
ncbi:MAG TPA: ATP-dependent helicase, partial [Myxococcales bacterium]|nr:DEAD/DEAH box helicase [Myxococcales bacterium]HAN30151.1 ATP-dependent helicase [Myxococcales bacterium]